MFKKKTCFVCYAVSFLVLAGLWFLTLPTIQINFWGLPILVLLFGSALIGLEVRINERISIPGIVIAVTSLAFLTVVPFVSTSPIFHADRYRSILGEVAEGVFSKDVSPVDLEQVRLVDREMAQRLGDKKLGEDPALGSQAALGGFSIQKVKDKLYWVAPLEHRSYWKWAGNREGTSGYVMVSATNPQDVRLVQQLGDRAVKIKYQPGAFFSEDLDRHIYFSGYFHRGRTDYTFEVDEEGNPFWVITLFKKEIGYAGNNATGVLIVDAQTGAMKEYGIAEAPLWVDRVQPEDFVMTQLDDWGSYVKGWLNSFLAEEGVMKVTPGMSLVYGEGNQSYWYTGITSSGADESTIGFVLVNTRTKETRFYKQSGATETAAMRSAEGKVQEKDYNATAPIMYNIQGVPTYVCSLKDKAGLVKLVAMVSVEDYTVLGTGETKLDALRAYRSALKDKGNQVDLEAEVNVRQAEGAVLRINADVRNGNTYYYLMVEGTEDKIFIAGSNVSQEIPLTRVGDRVFIRFEAGRSRYIDVVEFDNREF